MSDKGFLYPGAFLGRRLNESVFVDGDGSWPVMKPLPPSPVFNVWETPRVMISWDSETGQVKYMPLPADSDDA